MIAQHPGPCRPHAYQDDKYGRGFRVMNPVTEKGKIVGWRCTVCCPPKMPLQKRPGVYRPDELRTR